MYETRRFEIFRFGSRASHTAVSGVASICAHESVSDKNKVSLSSNTFITHSTSRTESANDSHSSAWKRLDIIIDREMNANAIRTRFRFVANRSAFMYHSNRKPIADHNRWLTHKSFRFFLRPNYLLRNKNEWFVDRCIAVNVRSGRKCISQTWNAHTN